MAIYTITGIWHLYESLLYTKTNEEDIFIKMGSHRNLKTQFKIFHDQQSNFHDYLMHRFSSNFT